MWDSYTKAAPLLVIRRVLAFLLCCVLPANPARAATDVGHWLGDAMQRTYDGKDGLATGPIESILQTSDGYLWFGGSGGLARFDGIRFLRFDRASAPDFTNTSVTSLAEDKDGVLWIATRGGLLFSYRKGKFQSIDVGAPILTLEYSVQDGLYLGLERGVKLLRDGKVIPWGQQVGLPEESIFSLWRSPDGVVWAGTMQNGVWRVMDGHAQCVSAGKGWEGRAFEIAGTPDGKRVWLATVRGLLQWSADSGTVQRVDSSTLMAMHRDPEGVIWGLQTNGDVLAWRDGAGQKRTTLNPDTRLFTGAIYRDREGNVWAGHEYGLTCLTESRFQQFGIREGLPSDMILAVTRARNGGWYIGTQRGLHVVDATGKLRRTIRKEDGLRDSGVFAIIEEPNGDFAVGSEAGLTFIRNGRFRVFDGKNFGAVLSLRRDRAGQLWVGTHIAGVLRWKPDDTYDAFGPAQGLADRQVQLMVDDKEGNLWVATRGGLSTIRNGRVRTWGGEDGARREPINSLLFDRRGDLWIGAASGLVHYQPGRKPLFRAVTELPFEEVSQLQQDDRGNLWMMTSQGIVRVALQELQNVVAGSQKTLNAVLMNESDGLRRAGAQLFGQKAEGITTGAGIVFGTLSGVARLTPAAMRIDNSSPPLVLEGIFVDGRPVPLASPVHVEAGARRIELHYSGLGFIGADRLRFRHLLEGFDPDWVEAGARRTATYTNLRPGDYTFRVKLANRDGLWQESSLISIPLHVAPHVWQTNWFVVLATLSLAALIFVILRIRDAQMRGRFEVALSERTRIARELHDTLLQGFAGVSWQVKSLVGWVPPDQPKLKHELDLALRRIDDCLVEARQAIADLRDSDRDLHDLAYRCQQLAENTAASSSTPITFHWEGRRRQLAYPLELTLFMVCREALNNAITHARCNQIAVTLFYRDREVELLIVDDGVGFTVQPSYNGHWGIQGMRERLQANRGRLDIASQPGQGTRLRAVVPL